ncbi:MAG: hypothetical protein ABIF11_05145 [Nitrospirota bacterium]
MKKQMNRLLGIATLACGLILATPYLANATATTNILISDANNHRVIEVDPEHNIVWQYGTVTAGSGTNQLNAPHEAVRLTNGNTLIADYGNYRVIEVTLAKGIVWEYKGPGEEFRPVDVRKLANGNVLITSLNFSRVLEVTPIGTNSGTVVWQCGWGTNISLSSPREVEKRPGTPTDYYLITDESNHRIIEVQRTGASGGTIVWQYGTGISGSGTNQLYWPSDAQRLISGNIFITDRHNHRIIEVQPIGTSGGTIVWECSANTGLPLFYPFEAIRMSNWNTLIVDSDGNRVIEVKTSDYPNFTPASIVWQQTGLNVPTDVEELGIVNIAKAEYKDSQGNTMTTKFAGIVVPLGTPTVNLPEITLSKYVDKYEPQQIGATLTYTIVYNNIGSGTATAVKITDMVPDETEYVVDSAKVISGSAATIEYSHDGGLNFDGSESDPVTHVRWNIDDVIPYGYGSLQFQVVIK